MKDSRATVRGSMSEVFATWQGEGIHVGRRHLFVRLAGCDVGCRFCDTPSALRRPGSFRVDRRGVVESFDNPIDVLRAAELVAAVARDEGPFHRLAVTGGEPLEQPDFLAALLEALEADGAPPVLLETAGTEPDALARVVPRVATVSMDVKLPSVAGTPPMWETHRRFLEVALATEVYVKAVVNDRVDDDDIRRAAEVVRSVDPSVTFIVQPETGRDGTLRASAARLASAALEAEAHGLSDVRILGQFHKGLGLQ